MIRIFFGNPGCGKTTTACKLLKKNKKDYDHTFCNFPLTEKYNIAYSVNSEQMKSLGMWTFPEYSYIAIDEAGIEYNNRKFKLLPQYTIEWFKLHRHYRCDVDVFSQSWEDMDITIRRLADQLWYLRGVGRKFGFTIQRRVYRRVMVDETTHQIIDGYRMEKAIWILLQPLRLLGLGKLFPGFFRGLYGWKLTFRWPYYKYFDSYSHPNIPVLAIPSDGPIPSPGDGSDSAESDHAGAGSPGALGRSRIASLLSRIRKYMQWSKNKLFSRTK